MLIKLYRSGCICVGALVFSTYNKHHSDWWYIYFVFIGYLLAVSFGYIDGIKNGKEEQKKNEHIKRIEENISKKDKT